MTKNLVTDDGTEVKILPLGSGGEVGRSCVIVTFKGKTIMFDCGIHPAKQGLDSLPLFDHVNMEIVDIVLITHFHLDHCAALPYLLAQTQFKGKVYMTSATKAFYKYVMNDFIRVGLSISEITNVDWVAESYDYIETIEYHQEIKWNGISIQAYNAGHVLGAAMFQVNIAGVKVLYTGDFSSEPDRHLMGAEIPHVSPDILIVESTYGIQIHESREEREAKFIGSVKEIVKRGGRCLIPVFALGRAQELLLILEEEWAKDPSLHNVKIFYASNLAQKCMKLYQRYVHSMNERVKQQQELTSMNPFYFRFISSLSSIQNIEDFNACVVIAAPGMLQSGISQELFFRWCTNRNNGIIFAGYCIDGTLAKEVMLKPKQVIRETGEIVPLRMDTIQTVSFSAHSDSYQTQKFIEKLKDVSHVVLVHGNEEAATKLQLKLVENFKKTKQITFHQSKNLVPILINFSSTKVAKIMGALAHKISNQSSNETTDLNRDELDGKLITGVIAISQDNQFFILNADEIEVFTGVKHTKITQSLIFPLPFNKSYSDIKAWFSNYFADSDSYSNFNICGVDISNESTQNGKSITELFNLDNDANSLFLIGLSLTNSVISYRKKDVSMKYIPNSSEVAQNNLFPLEKSQGVVVSVKTNQTTQNTTVTLLWCTAQITDLIADVLVLALCKLCHEHTQKFHSNEIAGDFLLQNNFNSSLHTKMNYHSGFDQFGNTLPVDVSDNIDKYFKIKSLHHLLAQFFPSVTTNLALNECHIVTEDKEEITVKDFVQISLTNPKDLHSTISAHNFTAVSNIVKRSYLAFFPIPTDFSWCECGYQHGEEHLLLKE